MPTLCERKTDISIIIPVYNLENYLAPMLDSLMAQNIGNYTAEIVFVLNNCTDNSAGVIIDSGIECRILNCTTQGCGPARNVGFEATTGTYVWFMDGDDWLLSSTAVKDVLDKAYSEDLDIEWIPFASDRFKCMYFSMVWQYLLKRDFVAEFCFPDYQPAEDDAYMINVLIKAGRGLYNYMNLPHLLSPQYFYNYLREGSNMYRHRRGERI